MLPEATPFGSAPEAALYLRPSAAAPSPTIPYATERHAKPAGLAVLRELRQAVEGRHSSLVRWTRLVRLTFRSEIEAQVAQGLVDLAPTFMVLLDSLTGEIHADVGERDD